MAFGAPSQNKGYGKRGRVSISPPQQEIILLVLIVEYGFALTMLGVLGVHKIFLLLLECIIIKEGDT